jgi:hypothetical protein
MSTAIFAQCLLVCKKSESVRRPSSRCSRTLILRSIRAARWLRSALRRELDDAADRRKKRLASGRAIVDVCVELLGVPRRTVLVDRMRGKRCSATETRVQIGPPLRPLRDEKRLTGRCHESGETRNVIADRAKMMLARRR